MVRFPSLIVCLVASSAYCLPVVVYDGPQSKPLISAIPTLANTMQVQSLNQSLAELREKAAETGIDWGGLQSELEPGYLEALQFKDGFGADIQPFFVMGIDDLSIRWLAHRYEKLTNYTKLCYVINPTSADDFVRLRSLYPDIIFIPAHGDFFKERLGVDRYPFFVDKKGIYQ